MAGIISDLGRRFNLGTIVVKYIYINVGVFVAIRLAYIVAKLFADTPSFLEYIELPSSPTVLAYRPWSVLTYMFVHFDFLHVLFNMLWLYWFGNIFLTFFSGRQLGGLYILGGIAGAAFFFVAYNILPMLQKDAAFSFLIGASASVMAIVFAVAFYRKDYQINLLLIGRIKLIYLALGVLFLDILAITSENTGGHIAHIGGAMLGIIFATQISRGKDITNFINRMIDWGVNLFRRKPKFKVYRSHEKNRSKFSATSKSAKPETDDEYLRRKNEENRVIDNILDKLKHSGYESLSAEEKKKLFDASRK
jgi:membrane associated rhomboid family serine protease